MCFQFCHHWNSSPAGSRSRLQSSCQSTGKLSFGVVPERCDGRFIWHNSFGYSNLVHQNVEPRCTFAILPDARRTACTDAMGSRQMICNSNSSGRAKKGSHPLDPDFMATIGLLVDRRGGFVRSLLKPYGLYGSRAKVVIGCHFKHSNYIRSLRLFMPRPTVVPKLLWPLLIACSVRF